MDVGRQKHRVTTAVGMLCRALCFAWLLPLCVMAADGQVVVVADQDNPVHQRFVTAFRLQHDSSTVVLTLPESTASGALQRASLVVTVGLSAARELLRRPVAVPVIHSLVSETDWQQLQRESGGENQRTAIYLEQPASRMLALVRTAFPERKRLTVAFGPSSRRAQASLEQVCRKYGLQCEAVVLEDGVDIDVVLRRAAASDRVLLLLPDPQVVNASTARTLILGAYRRDIALVGYSRALVKAGALMAVHSTPAQLGRDTAEMAGTVLHGEGGRVPPGRYPKRYSVSVNYQLARALNLSLDSETSLAKSIYKAERDD